MKPHDTQNDATAWRQNAAMCGLQHRLSANASRGGSYQGHLRQRVLRPNRLAFGHNADHVKRMRYRRSTATRHGVTEMRALLWIINLCSISASIFSYVYLSYYVYVTTGNVILSQSVLFAPMVLPVVLVGQVHYLANRLDPRSLLLWTNLCAVGVCGAIYSGLQFSPLLAIAGSLCIGALDAVQRVARIVAIKQFFRAQELRSTVPLTLTAQFIAAGLAGIAITFLRDALNPLTGLIITCALFCIASVAASRLPRHPPASAGLAVGVTGLWNQFLPLLKADPSLHRRFWAFVLFVSFFQGFFNVSRVALPAHVLQLSSTYVGLLQLLASVSALLSAIAYYISSNRSRNPRPRTMVVITSMALLASAYAPGVALSYLFYFFFIYFFEQAFFDLQTDLMAHTPQAQMPLIASAQYAAFYAGMILCIAVGSVLTSAIGLFATAGVLILTYLLLVLIWRETFSPQPRQEVVQ
jgi:hypothetical protein